MLASLLRLADDDHGDKNNNEDGEEGGNDLEDAGVSNFGDGTGLMSLQ